MRIQALTPLKSPLALADAKDHIRIEHTDEDALITSYMMAAVQWCEDFTRRSIVTRQWKMVLDRWPADRVIYLPKGNIQSVDSVVYADSVSTTATLAGPTSSPTGTGYQESLVSDSASYICPPYNGSWPSPTYVVDPISITFTAGYGAVGASPDPFPPPLILAIKVKIADYYERRSSDDERNVAHDAAMRLALPWQLPVWC